MNNNDYKGKMTNYNEGKIYKIESHLGDKIYIGSTVKKRLCDRMTYHRFAYKKNELADKKSKMTSYLLFEEYGLENCKIVLIENFPCNTKDELLSREAFYIRTMKCVNKNIPNRKSKEYRIDPVNKEKRLLYIQKYNEEHHEEIVEKGKVKTTCECGVCFRRADITKHIKTKKHLSIMASKLVSTQTQHMTHSEVPQLDNDISEALNNITL